MIDKISIGLAQSKKSYGLNKNNKIQEVLKELNNQDISNLDTSLSYNGSYNYLKVINLNEYKMQECKVIKNLRPFLCVHD